MGKGVIGIIFISLFILFGSVAFIIGQNGDNGDNGDEGPLAEGEGGPTCSDTDGGKVYGVKGTCEDNWGSYDDECSDSNSLNERYCNEFTLCAEEPSVACDDFCVNGACVECVDNDNCGSGESCDASGSCVAGVTTCTDPDGLDYYTRTTCSDSTGTTITDSCSGGLLYEAYCGTSGADSFCVTQPYDCPAGEVCSGGVCVVAGASGLCESIYLYSNYSTFIGVDHSIPSVTAASWTDDIPQASWIWEEATVSVGKGRVNTTITFTETFNLNDNDGAIGGVLRVAADNSYSCELNGVVVGADDSERNFETPDQYTITNEKFLIGENTLNCIVKNWGMPGADAGDNPAGLLYGLSIQNGDCDTSCSDNDGGINYLVPGQTTTPVAGHPDIFTTNMDSCSADGSTLTEYFCDPLGEIISTEYSCDCVDDGEGGYCDLSGAGMACEAFNSHPTGGSLISRTEMDGFVDEEIKDLLELDPSEFGYIGALTLSEVPVKSKVENVWGGVYYCGLDLLWHRVKPTVVEIACINDPDLDCLSSDPCLDDSECYLSYECKAGVDEYGQDIIDEDDQAISFCDYDTTCLEDNECGSNSCVDGYCISISAELIAQRGILAKIWCAVKNLPSFVKDGPDDSVGYLLCLENPFGGG